MMVNVRGASGEERRGYTTRPEIRSASYGEPLVGSSMLAQPGIDFDVRQFQPCGNEHFKNWRGNLVPAAGCFCPPSALCCTCGPADFVE